MCLSLQLWYALNIWLAGLVLLRRHRFTPLYFMTWSFVFWEKPRTAVGNWSKMAAPNFSKSGEFYVRIPPSIHLWYIIWYAINAQHRKTHFKTALQIELENIKPSVTGNKSLFPIISKDLYLRRVLPYVWMSKANSHILVP